MQFLLLIFNSTVYPVIDIYASCIARGHHTQCIILYIYIIIYVILGVQWILPCQISRAHTKSSISIGIGITAPVCNVRNITPCIQFLYFKECCLTIEITIIYQSSAFSLSCYRLSKDLSKLRYAIYLFYLAT